MMCMQLQQQVGEMEVREVVARAIRNRVRACLTGPPHHISHTEALLCFPTGAEKARKASGAGHTPPFCLGFLFSLALNHCPL